MGSFFLQKGLVVSRLGQIIEFEARTAKELYFEEPTTGKRITILESDFWNELLTNRLQIVDAFSSPNALILPTENHETQFKSLAKLKPKFQDDVERKVRYISMLREAGISRGQKFLITDQAKRISEDIKDALGVPGTSTIQRWWRELDRHNNEVYVLVSGHTHRQRASSIDADSEAYLQEQIDDHFLRDTRPTAMAAYRAYLSALKAKNAERAGSSFKPLQKVSERTFYARINQRPKKEVMIARFGREYTRRHFKMIKGHLPADHPLDVAEIDHTPLNLYAIDDMSFLPLGRPWLTVIKDRFSGVLLGLYISFQATGLNSIFGALKHSLTSHHLVYDLWPDIENPFPFGRAHYYESDRGPDFVSPRYRAAIVSLGSLYEYCERRTPWLKGSVERFFLTLEQTFFEAMPGRTFSSLNDRGDYDPVKDAVVRFSTLVYLIHKWAADFHNVLPNKRKQARPIDLWEEGTAEAPPPYFANIDELNIILGNHHSAVLSQEGLRHDWLTYSDDSLSALMDAVGKGVRTNFVTVSENRGLIYVENNLTKQYFPVPCTRPEYANNLSEFQHKYLKKEAAIRLERDSAVDILIDTRAQIQAVIKNELNAKATASKARLARVAGINSDAVLAGKAKSVHNPFEGQQVNRPPAENPAPTEATFTSVPCYRWGV